MQKISLALNLILVLAVAFLFFQFYGKKSDTGSEQLKPAENVEEIEEKNTKIAFINIDSLDLKYNYVIDAYEDLKSKTKRSQKSLQNKMEAAQQEYIALEQQAPTMTQEQLNAAQQTLFQRENTIRNFETNESAKLQKLKAKIDKKYRDNLNEYIDLYRAENEVNCILGVSSISSILYADSSYDITSEALLYLNEKYQEELLAEEEDK